MVDRTPAERNDSVPVENAVEAFLRDKGKGEAGESGNYRVDAGREVRRFIDWISEEQATGRTNQQESDASNQYVPTFADLDERVFRRYARELVSRGYAKGTIETYYAYIASFAGWAVDEGYLARHYANTSRAREPLPDDDGRRSGDQQAWHPEDRDRLTRHVDREAEAAIDGLDRTAPPDETGEYAAIRACRDRALVYILAYTAVRGAEIFRDRKDERRRGLRWRDINLDDRSMTVFRKTQTWSDAAIPEPAVHPLRIYRQTLDPPNEEWPVFPTFHYPTLGRLVREELAERGYTAEERERIREDNENDLIVCREHDLGPPASLGKDGARRRMKRLCDAANIEIDDHHGYLAPHGGRRGMGEVLVRQFGYAAAARYLDISEEVVRESYSHIEAGEQADLATEALAESDQRVSVRSPNRNDPGSAEDTEN